MKCEDVELKMIDYLDKNLEEGVSQQIVKHLETCEKCFDELKDTQELFILMSEGEMVKPDDSLRINFYHMLHSEIKKSEAGKPMAFRKSVTLWNSLPSYRIAAGIALLISGTFIGLLMSRGLNNSSASNELKQLHSEVSDLKKATMFTMLKQESSSDRIQAVRYVEDLEKPDQNIIDVLVKTLNFDKNVNYKFSKIIFLENIFKVK